MAGLLDFNDPTQAGLLAFAANMFNAGGPSRTPVGFGQAVASGLGGMQQAQQQAELLARQKQEQEMQMKMQQMKVQQFEQAMRDQEAAKQQAAMLPQIVAKFGDDYQGMIRAGIDPKFVKDLAESRNYGRDEVARVEEIGGANGEKLKQQFDKYGQKVGDALNGYVAPQLVDNGKQKQFVIPKAGAVFENYMSPSEQQSNARAWEGLRLQKQGLEQADRHFQGAQELKRSELGKKQEEIDMAKQGQLSSFDTMLGTLDRLQRHDGLSRSVGLYSKTPTIPGSDSANFQAELNTFKSQAFIPMVSQLKGMGALSDAEGKKLEQAVGALDPKMSEAAFRDSLKRIYSDMMNARNRAAKGVNYQQKSTTPSAETDIQELIRKYGG